MLKKDLILKSPVSKTLGIENIQDGRFGAVISRAGVGKTSFLVQIAITQLLRNKKILHISLVEPIEKINLRYSDGYTNLIDSIGYVDPQKALRLWEDIYPNKVGISYNELTFDTEKIREYLKSFKKADLALPSIIVMDGLNFDKDVSAILEKLDHLSQEFSVFIWFSIRCHREEKLCADGFPIQLENYKTLFDKALFLNPVEDKIEAIILKDGARTDLKFKLDSSTMMISEEG
ncbi:MAG: hypothetical protein A2277_11920 [Desulfobacterales bacterium RIFOXYA12_FULL_46_15]|nr:MAG: hypothetical protein A2277_11920 [Desulfobacterales bacterium RIFOXYA12_FULL_46_15]